MNLFFFPVLSKKPEIRLGLKNIEQKSLNPIVLYSFYLMQKYIK